MDLDLILLNFPLRCGSRPDPPQFPPWVWAWIRGPHPPRADNPPEQTTPWSRHPPVADIPPGADTPLGADTPWEQTPPWEHTPEQTPPGSRHPPKQTPPKQTPPRSRHPPWSRYPPWRPAARHAGIPPAMHTWIAPPPTVYRITDMSKNITLATTSLRPVKIASLLRSL